LTLAVCAALFVAAALLYWPATAHDFVSLDDPTYVFDNPRVKAGLSWEGVRWAWTHFHASNWHPMTWWSLQLDATLFGEGPRGFHIVNVVLHAASAAVLFLALQMMTGAPWASAAVAALFAVHPLRVESVAWVSERKDVLCGFFWMTTLVAYAWYVRLPNAWRYAAVCVSLALALLAKPMAVTLPCVLMLLDWWPLRRWAGDGRRERPLPGPPPRPEMAAGEGMLNASSHLNASSRRPSPVARLFLEKVPLFALVAVSIVTTIAAQSRGAMSSLDVLPIGVRALNALAAYGAYLWKTLWPTRLAVFYPHPAFISADPIADLFRPGLAGAAVLVGVSALAAGLAWRRPYVTVGWFWYVGTLLPVSGLFQAGQQGMADRFAYLPLIGIYIAVAWAARDVARRRPATRPVWAAVAVAAVALCAVTTRRQIAVWSDGVTLFTHAVAVTRDNYFAHTNLAAVMMALGREDEAYEHYQAALRIYPRYATALTGLASIEQRRGHLDAAAELGMRALAELPDSPVVLANLGAVRVHQGRLDEAAVFLARAVDLAPDYALAHSNLGAVYFRQGQVDRAAEHFERAAALNPNSVGAHSNLGLARLQQGRWADAAAAFEAALRIQPNNVEIQRSLANARAHLTAP
jgi:tetratricopeptide (TPR) repeat protein